MKKHKAKKTYQPQKPQPTNLPATPEAVMAKSIEALNAGRLPEALALCQNVLRTQQSRPDAWNLLGVIYRRSGRSEEAMAAYRQSIQLKPDFADPWNNLGALHKQNGNLDEAIQCFRKVMDMGPHMDAYNRCAEALRMAKRYLECEAVCQQGLQIAPDNAEMYLNLGNLLYDQDQLAESIPYYRQAIQRRPVNFPAYHNLGIIFRKLSEFAASEQALLNAIRIDPNSLEAQVALMHTYQDQGRLEEAVQLGHRLHQSGADTLSFCVMYGNVLQLTSRLDDALVCYRHALSIDDSASEAHLGLGSTYYRQGRFGEAIVALRRAIELNEEHAEAWNNLANVHRSLGEQAEAIRCFRQVLLLQPQAADKHSNLLLTLNYSPDYDRQALFEEHLRYDAQHIKPLAKFIKPHTNLKDPHRKLNIGYVSADLRRHPVAVLAEPFMARHNRDAFRVYAYYNYARKDEITQRFQSYTDTWVDCVGMNDMELAERIRSDGIDILIDLSGHTAYNRLLMFGHKPAPIQMSFIGYPNTTGMSTMDYRFTDICAEPPGSEAYSSEALIHLPSGCAYQAGAHCPEPRAQAPVFERGYITYGSFNNFAKVTDQVLATWAIILNRVGDARLLIEAPGLEDAGFRQRVESGFQAAGVAQERLTLLSRAPENQYKLYQEVDICLDSFPFNGGTTNCDTVWLGVPLITLTGEILVSRMGLQALSSAGLPELVATTVEEYIDKAVALGTDRDWLRSVRSTIRRDKLMHSALFNPELYTRHLEAAYREAWRKWCQNSASEISI